jgi:uncharacterized membrane protein YidH (DUF202 family)
MFNFAKDVIATILIVMGILLIVYGLTSWDNKIEVAKRKVLTASCEAKGGTYFLTEDKCLAIKEIK